MLLPIIGVCCQDHQTGFMDAALEIRDHDLDNPTQEAKGALV